jgi:Rps23 Pro-64 3,4-dihydroxylase Tpa1-like proline 4-hydroxylase
LRKPEHRSGFFIPDLVENVFGEDWAKPSPVPASAENWSHPSLRDPEVVSQVNTAFAEGGRVPHVCLSDVLQPERAEAIHAALERARFVRHHHAPYPLSIARLEELEPSTLTEFTHWLRTEEATAYHAWLVGWPGRLISKQVQVSRMGVGEQFPVHVDTHEEGLAVVYNFTRDWEERFGGVLHFPHPSGTWDDLRVPPLFNSAFIFRSADVPHGVSQVTSEAGSRYRYTITTFLLAPG